MKTRTIILEKQGPASVMSLETVDIDQPDSNEVQISKMLLVLTIWIYIKDRACTH